MANFRKSFNFRNGVQVDDDNLLVNATGLVGIGTTIPAESLDVRGNTRVSGVTSSTNVYVTSNFEVAPTGIATVGVLSVTDVNITGVITATSLRIGNSEIVDNLIGFARTSFLTDNAGVGLHTLSKIGITTSTSPVAADPSLSVYGDVVVKLGIGGTGVVTATRFDGDIDAAKLFTGTLPDDRFPATLPAVSGANLTSLNGTNITSGTIAAARITDPLNQNTTGTAGGLTGTPDITVGSVTGSSISLSSDNVTVVGETGHIETIGDIRTTGSVGVGTTNPTQNLTVKDDTGNATLEVIAPNNRAQISIGQSVGLGNSSSMIRYNNKKLESINFDTGDIDTVIHNGGAGLGTGNFRWIYGQSNAELMTLTWEGNFGINNTSPEHKLSVSGISTFTGKAHFNDDLTVDGTLFADVDLTGKLLDNNIHATSGISTFNELHTTSELTTVNRIGIGTTNASDLVGQGLDCSRGNGNFKQVGVASFTPRAAVDFSRIVESGAAGAYMILPVVTNAQRGNITAVAGGLIYNSDSNKLQVFNGTSWETVTSS